MPNLATLNKPSSISAWLASGHGSELSETHELIVVDSDFIFFGPIPNRLSEVGKPAAAHFAINPRFLKDERIMRYCVSKKCKELENAGVSHDLFELGPPYVARVGDWKKIAHGWYIHTLLIAAALDQPDWYADMYAYVFAARNAGLETSCIWGLEISCL